MSNRTIEKVTFTFKVIKETDHYIDILVSEKMTDGSYFCPNNVIDVLEVLITEYGYRAVQRTGNRLVCEKLFN